MMPPQGRLHKIWGQLPRSVINTDTFMTIIGILRWSFVRHSCSANQELSISVIYSSASGCLCVFVWVCGPAVWVIPAALTADQSFYRSSADQHGPPECLHELCAGCFQHHGQRHQQQQRHDYSRGSDCSWCSFWGTKCLFSVIFSQTDVSSDSTMSLWLNLRGKVGYLNLGYKLHPCAQYDITSPLNTLLYCLYWLFFLWCNVVNFMSISNGPTIKYCHLSAS